MATMTMPPPLEVLLQRAIAGDSTAFWELVGPHERTVFAVAYGVLRDPERAQDVVHDTWVRAFSTLGGIREASKVSSWLYGMARNIAHEHMRKDIRQEKIVAASPADAKVISIPDIMMEAEDRAWLAKALDQLPEPHRVVIAMKYMNNLSCKEIADTLDIGVEAAKSRLFEARKALRQLMLKLQRPAISARLRRPAER